MSSSLVLLVLVGVLYAAGVYLLLDRSLTRVLLGVLVLGNATNVLLVVAGGPTGAPAFVGGAPEPAMSDALVQALVLTAIVITLGVAAFVLALIHRTWAVAREDEVRNDATDRALRDRLARRVRTGEDELDTSDCAAAREHADDRGDRAGAGDRAGDRRAPVGSGEPT